MKAALPQSLDKDIPGDAPDPLESTQHMETETTVPDPELWNVVTFPCFSHSFVMDLASFRPVLRLAGSLQAVLRL